MNIEINQVKQEALKYGNFNNKVENIILENANAP